MGGWVKRATIHPHIDRRPDTHASYTRTLAAAGHHEEVLLMRHVQRRVALGAAVVVMRWVVDWTMHARASKIKSTEGGEGNPKRGGRALMM